MKKFMLTMLIANIFILNMGATSLVAVDESEYPDSSPNPIYDMT